MTVVKFIFRMVLSELGVTQFSSLVNFSLGKLSTDGSMEERGKFTDVTLVYDSGT